MFHFNTRLFCTVLLFSLLLSACKKDENVNPPSQMPTAFEIDHTLATQYVDLARTLTKQTPGFSPPVAARAFGYVGLTLYQSVVHGMPGYRSLQGTVNDLQDMPVPTEGLDYYWPASMNAAMANTLKRLYPTAPAAYYNQIDSLEGVNWASFQDKADGETLNRSRQFGLLVSSRIYAYSFTDGGHEGYLKNFPTTYIIPEGPGMWRATSATSPRPLQPFWGNNRTFAPGVIDASKPAPPPPFSTDVASDFYIDGIEVYNIGKALTTEQSTIAKYWSDDPGVNGGTPPGHSMSIVVQVLQKENATLGMAAEAFCKVGMALSDGFVACWHTKYLYNTLRPVTYINDQIDPTWKPLLNTPPFPEYTSGHSVQTAAACGVLDALFGKTYTITDRTHEARTDINGAARTFTSFQQIANEAAISRLYGGIHYKFGIDNGVVEGGKVADVINALKFK